MLKKLELTAVNRWVHTNSDPGYIDIPMWGENTKGPVSDNMSVTGVKMVRMVARMNITIDPVIRTKFQLVSAHLYNHNTGGRIAPDDTNLAIGSVSQVESPTLVTGGTTTRGPINYTSILGPELLNTIYTFEAEVPYNGTEVVLDKVPSLVIGGYYDTDATLSYYRVDFASKKPVGVGFDYIDILRNHSYNITITNIKSGGHASADDAFDSGAINLETKIDAVDDNEMNDITFNEHNQLVVDRDELTLYAEGEAVGMRIFTDYIKGWKVDATNKPSWITLSPSSDASAVTKPVAVSATPITVGSPSRSGSIIITAGPLKKTIKVTQKGDPGITLTVSPSVLVFRKNPVGPQSVTVTSYPAALARMMSYVGSVTWATGSHPVNDMNNLTLNSYNFTPAVNNTGAELRGVISIMVELPTGESEIRTVEVVHLHTNAVFAATGVVPYPAAYGPQSFNIESELRWRLNKQGNTGDPSNIIGTYPTNEQDATGIGSTVPFTFSLAENPTYASRSAKFFASSTTSPNDFPANQSVTITQVAIPLKLEVPSTDINFGLTTAAQKVTLKTNSGWSVSNISNGNILTTCAPAVGAVQLGSTSALVDASGTITMTPSTAYANMGPAGAVLSGIVTVKTANHTGATALSKTFNIKRTVPSVFSVASLSPNSIPLIGGGVIATNIASNNKWTLSSNLTGTTPYTFTPTNYGTTASTVLTIPANTLWGTARGFTVSVASTGHTPKTLAVTQPGYTFAYSSGFPATVPPAGGTYNVVFKSPTASPIVYVRIVSGTDVVSASKAVPAITTAGGTQPISMPISAAWSVNRTVTLQWTKESNNTGWIPFVPNITASQTSYTLPSGYNISPEYEGDVAAFGKRFTASVTSTGAFGAIPVRITSNGVTVTTGSLPAGQTSASVVIILGTNPAASVRGYKIEYLHPKTKVWTTFTNGTGWQSAAEGIYVDNLCVMFPHHILWPAVTAPSRTDAEESCRLIHGREWNLPSSSQAQKFILHENFIKAYTPVLETDPLVAYLSDTVFFFWCADVRSPFYYRTYRWTKATKRFSYSDWDCDQNMTNRARGICVRMVGIEN